MGQYFGHSHQDFFNVNLDPSNTTRGTGAVLLAGSITPYSNLNSGGRVVEMDSKTKATLDIYNYIFNMTEANLAGSSVPPRWYDRVSAGSRNNDGNLTRFL